MSIQTWKVVSLATLTVLVIPTYAAIDGELGNTSTASININLTVLPKIQIKQLEDFQMTVTEDTNANSVEQIKSGCVVSNNQSGYYTLTATNAQGESVNDQYQMRDGKGGSVNYTMSAGNGDGNFQSITSHAVKLKADRSVNCSSGKNLQLKVQLTGAAQLKPGSYGDVVQLQVVPL